MKIIKTHGGLTLFTRKCVYKFIYGKRIKQLFDSQNNFYKKSNQLFLIQSNLVFRCLWIQLTKEIRLKNILNKDFNQKEILINYGLLIKNNLRIENKVDLNLFLENNFKKINNKKYLKKINEIVYNINLTKNKITMSLIHGDFWEDNIIITENNFYFIDYDRSREYSFLELDLINFYVFKKVYESNPSWDQFFKIFNNILKKEKTYYNLLSFIDSFYDFNKLESTNKKIIDELLKLFVLKILYDNNKFLSFTKALKWFRFRHRLEKLIWN